MIQCQQEKVSLSYDQIMKHHSSQKPQLVLEVEMVNQLKNIFKMNSLQDGMAHLKNLYHHHPSTLINVFISQNIWKKILIDHQLGDMAWEIWKMLTLDDRSTLRSTAPAQSALSTLNLLLDCLIELKSDHALYEHESELKKNIASHQSEVIPVLFRLLKHKEFLKQCDQEFQLYTLASISSEITRYNHPQYLIQEIHVYHDILKQDESRQYYLSYNFSMFYTYYNCFTLQKIPAQKLLTIFDSLPFDDTIDSKKLQQVIAKVFTYVSPYEKSSMLEILVNQKDFDSIETVMSWINSKNSKIPWKNIYEKLVKDLCALNAYILQKDFPSDITMFKNFAEEIKALCKTITTPEEAQVLVYLLGTPLPIEEKQQQNQQPPLMSLIDTIIKIEHALSFPLLDSNACAIANTLGEKLDEMQALTMGIQHFKKQSVSAMHWYTAFAKRQLLQPSFQNESDIEISILVALVNKTPDPILAQTLKNSNLNKIPAAVSQKFYRLCSDADFLGSCIRKHYFNVLSILFEHLTPEHITALKTQAAKNSNDHFSEYLATIRLIIQLNSRIHKICENNISLQEKENRIRDLQKWLTLPGISRGCSFSTIKHLLAHFLVHPLVENPSLTVLEFLSQHQCYAVTHSLFTIIYSSDEAKKVLEENNLNINDYPNSLSHWHDFHHVLSNVINEASTSNITKLAKIRQQFASKRKWLEQQNIAHHPSVKLQKQALQNLLLSPIQKVLKKDLKNQQAQQETSCLLIEIINMAKEQDCKNKIIKYFLLLDQYTEEEIEDFWQNITQQIKNQKDIQLLSTYFSEVQNLAPVNLEPSLKPEKANEIAKQQQGNLNPLHIPSNSNEAALFTDEEGKRLLQWHEEGCKTQEILNRFEQIFHKPLAKPTLIQFFHQSSLLTLKNLEVQASQIASKNIHDLLDSSIPPITHLCLDSCNKRFMTRGILHSGILVTVMGIRKEDGKRCRISQHKLTSNTSENWLELLSCLKERGLKGPFSVINDQSEHLLDAVKILFPEQSWDQQKELFCRTRKSGNPDHQNATL